jgi:hypothetical protein
MSAKHGGSRRSVPVRFGRSAPERQSGLHPGALRQTRSPSLGQQPALPRHSHAARGTSHGPGGSRRFAAPWSRPARHGPSGNSQLPLASKPPVSDLEATCPAASTPCVLVRPSARHTPRRSTISFSLSRFCTTAVRTVEAPAAATRLSTPPGVGPWRSSASSPHRWRWLGGQHAARNPRWLVVLRTAWPCRAAGRTDDTTRVRTSASRPW